ncbi:MATE family efflux transporter [Alphaproteobacteria bacterium]|nr:MATE family efflux transporter [Alphaproteobacteria bacterium]
MILSNISTPLLGLIDTSIIGRISVEQIGAIAIGSSILSFFYFCFGFFRMGTTGLIAQAYGQKDDKKIINIIKKNLLLAMLFGLLCIPTILFLKNILVIIFTDNENILIFTKSYINIRIFGAPATFINFVIFGILLGSNKPWQIFKLVLFINTLNIALDLFLGMYLGLNIKGIAIGTIISEYAGVILGLYYIKPFIPLINLFNHKRLFQDNFNLLFKTNTNLFIRTFLILMSILIFTAIGSRLGETILAANAILIILQMFISYSLDGFAQASEVLIGNEYGRKNKRNITKIIISSCIISCIFALLYSIIFYFFSMKIIGIITPLNEVLFETKKYITWIIISPLVSFLAFQLDGVFIGANKTKIMRNTVFQSFIIYLLSLIILVPLYDNHGLWISFLIFISFRGLLLLTQYKKIYQFN